MAFAIKVNDGGVEDTEAWTADYGADEIVGISVQSAGGEVARLQVDNASPGIRLEIVRRNSVDSTFLDMEELRRREERSGTIEEANASLVQEGRAATDSEEIPLTAPSDGGFTGSTASTAAIEPAATPETTSTEGSKFDTMTKADLQQYATDNNIEGVNQDSMTKQEMIDKINAG